MQSAESTLLAKLRSRGFEVEDLQGKQKKSVTDYAKEVYEEASADSRPTHSEKTSFQKNAVEARDGDGDRIGLIPRWLLVIITTILPFGFLHPMFWFFSALLGVPFAIFGVMFSLTSYQDVWVRGLWRYLTDFSGPEPISDEEVIEHLSTQLREEKEKALGVTIADEKQKLEEAKSQLQDHRRTLRSQRKGNENHGLDEEIDGFIQAINDKIDEIDAALERIDTFLAKVRQLAQDIASEILPIYRRRQKILETFEQVPVELEKADEYLESAEAMLEESRLNLDHKLEALQSAITQANQVSAELGKLTAEDALEEGGMDGVIGSVEQLNAAESKSEDVQLNSPQRVRS